MQVSLYASFGTVDEVDRLFEHLPAAGIDRFVLPPTDWAAGPRPSFWDGQIVGKINRPPSYPFGAAASPGLARLRDDADVRAQLDVGDAAYRRCRELGIEFYFTLVLPKFPFNAVDAVRRELPHLYGPEGTMDLGAPDYLRILDGVLDDVRGRYPEVSGFMISLAEGSGATVHEYQLAEFEDVDRWLAPWLTHLVDYGERYHLDMLVFAHHYTQTRGTRSTMHELVGSRPQLELVENLTWPEEHRSLPYLGYLADEQVRRITAANPVHIKFLLDTEYMGQGRIPSVVPSWIAAGIRAVGDAQAAGVMGRINYWDGRGTMDGWNVVNLDVFCTLARDPGADTDRVLRHSLARRLGPGAGDLADLLRDAEACLSATQTLHGIPYTDHSAFPPPRHLHDPATPHHMRAIDDLFRPAGSPLFGPTSDSLRNSDEWRHQLRFVTRSADDYLTEHADAAATVEKLYLRCRSLAAGLSSSSRAFVTRSFASWRVQTQAHGLFVEAAASRADLEGGTPGASNRLKALGPAMERLADDVAAHHGEHAIFDLAPRLRRMAAHVRDIGILGEH